MTNEPTSNPANQQNIAPTDDTPARPSPQLLEFLVCPVTKTTLELSSDKTELISRTARLAFPIRDGIPMMLVDTARELTDDDLKK